MLTKIKNCLKSLFSATPNEKPHPDPMVDLMLLATRNRTGDKLCEFHTSVADRLNTYLAQHPKYSAFLGKCTNDEVKGSLYQGEFKRHFNVLDLPDTEWEELYIQKDGNMVSITTKHRFMEAQFDVVKGNNREALTDYILSLYLALGDA